MYKSKACPWCSWSIAHRLGLKTLVYRKKKMSLSYLQEATFGSHDYKGVFK